ncbi:chemotaxis protein CheW [Salipiger marinus]|uniref:chemotaxis protein CheW n=1 Tax=Salipiger marinus TaxID=555512 RepID=UPI002CBB84E9|nr:chemotaxis protein CheW [Salipiger manganoxidans]MEB3420687.1 chemotaxis protein CheW [Salipiger manganoxidans]
MSLDESPGTVASAAEAEAVHADDPTAAGAASGRRTTAHAETYGLVGIAGTLVAIEVLHIREAVPFPGNVSPLAMDLPGLLGAMVLRQDTIPLTDIGAILGLYSEQPLSERVVIILMDDSQQRMIGLVVDSLQGMTSLDDQHLAEMGVVGSAALLAGGRSFVHDGLVVGILDPRILFDQPQLPFAHQRARPVGGRQAAQGGRSACLLCSYNGHGIAFPVEDIHATIPMHTLRDSPIAHGPCDGVIQLHGADIPILDSLQVLGLGANFCRPERSASVAMRVPAGGYVAFEIDRFFDIVHIRNDELLDVPSVISTRKNLFCGIHMRPDGSHYLVMDSGRVLRDQALEQLAATTAKDMSDPGAVEALGPAELYLVSRSAQQRMACRLIDIVEILRLPESLLYAETRHDGYMGVLSHRARVVPIFSVASVLGEFAFYEENKACVLLFRLGEQLFGAAVEQLEEVTRCQPIGREAEKMLRKPDTGEFIQHFDLARELPVSGGFF